MIPHVPTVLPTHSWLRRSILNAVNLTGGIVVFLPERPGHLPAAVIEHETGRYYLECDELGWHPLGENARSRQANHSSLNS